MVLNSPNLFGNSARGPLTPGTTGPGDAPGLGGALHASGAATIFVSGGIIRNNAAARDGGAIWLASAGVVRMDGTVLQENSAQGEAAGNGGGAIYSEGGLVSVRRASLLGNTANGAAGSGGAVLNQGGRLEISNSTLENNAANRAGGAIETVGGRVALVNVALNTNSAGVANEASGPGNGGALHAGGAANVFMVRGEVQGNDARGEGGGLWNGASVTLVVEGTLIAANVCDQSGGAIYNDGGALTVRRAKIDFNTALGAGDGAGGGGILNKGNANVESCEFAGNTATRGQGSGGAILSSGVMVVSQSLLSNNEAARGGGAIENSGQINVVRTSVRSSRAGARGGGLHNVGRAFVIASTWSGNRAQSEGGALWNGASGTLAVRNSTLDSNSAASGQSAGGGGGIYNDGGVVSLDSATITGNVSGSTVGASGGGIFNNGTLNSINSVIALNRDESGLDVVGPFNSQGYNFIGAASGITARSGDRSGTIGDPLDPQLDFLTDNGGPTQTRLPQAGSPLIDAGNTATSADQRGVLRPQGARADIGAVEVADGGASSAAAKSALKTPPMAPSSGSS